MSSSQDLNNARKILGISKDANPDDVKKRYKYLAKKWHPDINKSKESNKMMQDINNSYELVMEEEFGVIDPWDDYNKWWWKQYGNDPCWGNPSAEKFHKTKKYAGIRKSKLYIKSTKHNPKKDIAKEFLNKKC